MKKNNIVQPEKLAATGVIAPEICETISAYLEYCVGYIERTGSGYKINLLGDFPQEYSSIAEMVEDVKANMEYIKEYDA